MTIDFLTGIQGADWKSKQYSLLKPASYGCREDRCHESDCRILLLRVVVCPSGAAVGRGCDNAAAQTAQDISGFLYLCTGPGSHFRAAVPVPLQLLDILQPLLGHGCGQSGAGILGDLRTLSRRIPAISHAEGPGRCAV